MYLSKRLSSEIIEGSGYRTGLFPPQSLACKQLPTAVATPAAKNERRESDELFMDRNLPAHGPERQNHLPAAYPVSPTLLPAPSDSHLPLPDSGIGIRNIGFNEC